jgi:hypothetical protein
MQPFLQLKTHPRGGFVERLSDGGARELTGANLKVVWAEFSTLS